MPRGVYDHKGKRIGHKHSEETKRKIGLGNSGEKSGAWKGDKVGYIGLHVWVSKELGKPRFCEECKNSKLNHRQYHWANISGKYKRALSDWRRLCATCHAKFDGNRGRKKLIVNK